MLSRIQRFCKEPVGFGVILVVFGLIFFLLPFAFGVKADAIDLDYGDIVAIGAFVATVAIAVFSIIPNLKSMVETSRSAAETSRSIHYSELDSMYLQILAMAVEKPHLRQPDKLETWAPDQDHQYSTYAFIVWNFIETIHDRCLKDADAELRSTWAPVITAENDLHGAWFVGETVPYKNIKAPKFCLQFCDFIWEKAWTKENWFYRPETTIKQESDYFADRESANAG